MLMLFIVVASSVWVLFDAKSIGVKAGLVPGLGNMGPWAWFACTLGLWIISFPAYVFHYRSRYKDVLLADRAASVGQPESAPAATLSGWAISAFYCGLLSVLLIPAPIAIVSGILALKEIKAHPNKSGKARAIFGIVAGAIVLSLFGLGLLGRRGGPHP